MFQAEGQQVLQEMQVSLSAILSEANSADPWTRRARPTFLYVIYGVILLSVIGSVIGLWWPAEVFQAAENLSKLLNAVPESLWWLFGAGYLGYTGARSFDKGAACPDKHRQRLQQTSSMDPVFIGFPYRVADGGGVFCRLCEPASLYQ